VWGGVVVFVGGVDVSIVLADAVIVGVAIRVVVAVVVRCCGAGDVVVIAVVVCWLR